MLNICKSLINVVRANKPKVLTGLTQTGMRPGAGNRGLPLADRTVAGGQAGAKRSIWNKRGTW